MKKKLALALVAALTMSVFVGCAAPEENDTTPDDTPGVEDEVEDEDTDTDVTYTDGTYEGVGEGYGGEIKVNVEVADGAISSVEILEHSETEGIADHAPEEIAGQIVEQQSTQVDVVSGATLASEGTMEAVENALEEAQ